MAYSILWVKTQGKMAWDNMTIEPAMFLMAFGNSMGMAAWNQLLLYKSCINDFGQDDATCNNLTAKENEALKHAVTSEVSHGITELEHF